MGYGQEPARHLYRSVDHFIAAKAILLNKGLIAINQDSLGQPVKLVERRSFDYDLHAGKLANGDLAVLAFDWTNTQRTITVNFADLNIAPPTSPICGPVPPRRAPARIASRSNGLRSVALRLSNVKYSSTAAPTLAYQNADKSGVLGWQRQRPIVCRLARRDKGRQCG